MARPDLVAKTSKHYPADYSSSEERSSEESADSPLTPRMTQGKNSSSTSTSSAYPHDTRSINDDVKKDIQETRKLNTVKEELWAKFAEKTEVNVVTRLESLSSSEIGEFYKWSREKVHPQINVLSISKSDIDDKAANSLAKAIRPKSTLDKLTTLKLGQKLSKLATLELVGNTISDEGFKTLAKVIQTNTTITTLNIDMEGNTTNVESIKALANAISTNHTMTTLKICVGGKIEDGGADALVELLEKNETLKSVDLKGNSFTEEQKKRFHEASLKNTNSKIEYFWYG
jgi:hypothetical protein